MESVAELTVADWHRLNRLLETGLELEPEARCQWLASGAVADDSLHGVLRTLLEKADEDAVPALEAQDWHAAGERPGDTIGPFRLVRELAVGGMGVVWVAERSDGAFERRVALKLPRAEWAAPGLAERMARERAILASLVHPNIAQLYDAGWSPQGRPYLAIELVDGVPIDQYCVQQRLTVHRRVELFVEAVRAVAFAHSRLVVHRDLKPANVMVRPEGRVKLLDFGIAKLLTGDGLTGEETAMTRVGGRALTIAYAAPEQLLGRAVSAATDVYSLGVMLYELLAGDRLYRAGGTASNAALEAEILHAEPEPPSRAAKRDGRSVRGDLDTIVLKALKKAPEQRYESAAALAEDLERYLSQQPIRARPDSRAYRVRMFLRRHRLPVLVASALAVTIVGGAIVALWQAQAANEEAKRADAIKEFVLSMIRQADPLASAATREADAALLSTAEARIVEEMGAQPRTSLELRLAIAEAYANRGMMNRARATLRVAVKDAKARLDRHDPDLARTLIAASQNFVFAGDDMLADLDLAIETARFLGSRGRRLLVEGLRNRGVLGAWAMDPDKGARDLLEAYELSMAAFGPADPLTLSVAVAIAWPSVLRVDKAAVIATAYRAGLASAAIGPSHPTLLRAQALHAYYLAKAGQTEEALALVRAAVETARRHHGEVRPTEEVLTAAILAYVGARDFDAALSAGLDAYRIAANRIDAGAMLVGLRAQNVVSLMVSSRRLGDVEELLIKKDPSEGPSDPKYRRGGSVIRNAWRGHVLLLQGSTEESETQLREAVREFEALGFHRSRSARIPLAWALRENGRPAEAIEVLRAVNPATLVWDDDRQSFFNQLAASHLALGHTQQALQAADRALAEDASRPPFTPDGADAYLLRGRALLSLGRADEAIAALAVSDAFWRSFDPGTPWAAEAFYWHGVAVSRSPDVSRGRALMREALPALRTSPMPSHRVLAAGGP